ncbi:MAG: ABC transporter ATP-binding protein [Treponema sp.]|nr:ABC transporter ATP-binding protein [Treponema sp.]
MEKGDAVDATSVALGFALRAKPVISMRDVTKVYAMGEESVHALRGISFDIAQGEFVSIMGPSGSGKSTCMNMIGCLDRPTSGIVEIGGKETARMNERELAVLRNQTVGFVFQQYHLLPAMTVLENVMLPLRYQGIERADRKAMAEAALERVGLENRMKHLPNELSGGQKQRVAIARATVTRPSIILADEPTGALDSATGKAVLELFGEINASGTTIVIVTHDPKIGASTKRCIRILDGLIQSDTMNEPEGADA